MVVFIKYEDKSFNYKDEMYNYGFWWSCKKEKDDKRVWYGQATNPNEIITKLIINAHKAPSVERNKVRAGSSGW